MKKTKLGQNTELIEREEPEMLAARAKQVSVDAYLDALWTYCIGLARAGVDELHDKPSRPEDEEAFTYLYVQVPLDVMMAYHSRAGNSLTASLQTVRATS